MPEKAVISHRGEKYEIGRGKRFYGIWALGAPYDMPVDRWPENRDGWQQAWSRYSAIEVPGTIGSVTRERKGFRRGLRLPPGPRLRSRSGHSLLVGEGLLVLGVVLGLAGLFPVYEGRQSLLSQADQVVPHLFFLIGWMVAAALAAFSVIRPSSAARYGALFGLGLSAVTLGLFLADLGQVVSGGASSGTGLILSLAGWLACTAGSAFAFAAGTGHPEPPAAQHTQPGRYELRSGPVRPGRRHAGPLALLVLAAIGAAVTFAPSWDRYILTAASSGTSQTITAGDAFSNPGLVIAGNVLVMVAIVAVAAFAALWRPARHGALLLAGAIVPLAAEAASAIIQSSTPATPAMFGVSSAQAAALGLTISTGLTAIFWVFFVFVISLLISCAWLFTEPGHPVMPGFPASPWLPAGEDAGTGADPHTEAAGDDADSDVSHVADSKAADSDTGGEGGEQSAYA
ncbi:MAG TPA: hypothetical protein VGD91_13965 [Trebonia sp.]